MSGRPTLYTETYLSFTHNVREMREFIHLRANLPDVLRISSDQTEWEPDLLRAYQAALPSLLWAESSIMNNEAALSRDKRINPHAMLRRIGFLYGVTCICGEVHGGYSALPISTSAWDAYRRPFASRFAGVLEPLCRKCRVEFREWCAKLLGVNAKPSDDEVELCATGWVASTIKRAALTIARDRVNA